MLMLKAIIYLSLFLAIIVLLAFIPLPFRVEGAWDSRVPTDYWLRIKVGPLSYTYKALKEKTVARKKKSLKRFLAPGNGRLGPALRFLLKRFRLKELLLDLGFSLGDPAATALAWGVAEGLFWAARSAFLSAIPRDRGAIKHSLTCLWQEEAGARCYGRCIFHLAPGHIVITLLIMAASERTGGGVKHEPAASY